MKMEDLPHYPHYNYPHDMWFTTHARRISCFYLRKVDSISEGVMVTVRGTGYYAGRLVSVDELLGPYDTLEEAVTAAKTISLIDQYDGFAVLKQLSTGNYYVLGDNECVWIGIAQNHVLKCMFFRGVKYDYFFDQFDRKQIIEADGV